MDGNDTQGVSTNTGTPNEGVSLNDLSRLTYSSGRVLLLLGVVICGVGTIASPIESALAGEQFLSMSSLATGLGGQLVGYGAVLVAVARSGEVRDAFRGADKHVPGVKARSDD